MITGVAVLSETGDMLALPKPYRHHHLFALAALMGVTLNNEKQGFTTKDGHFVTRKAAFNLVVAHNQSNRRSGNANSDELFSEDVW